jgi:YTH domain-containing family protein
MSPSQPVHPLSPPPVPQDSTGSSGVRRHHTITAASRPPRQRTIEEDQGWPDDEPVDQDWVGGVGAVGESNLHRQASLPTRYGNRRAYC